MNLLQKIAVLPDALAGRLFVDPERNGEYRFARSYVRDRMIVFDVGANIGDYARYLFGLARQLDIHCFEPISSTFATLERNLNEHAAVGDVSLNNFALGEHAGSAEMFVYQENAGSNSFYFNDYHAGFSRSLHKERVNVTTVDDYVEGKNVPHIELMKIDVEGHEMSVIRGAEKAIRQGRVACIQFEYNNYWQCSGDTLVEMLEHLRQLNSYSFFRLTPWGRLPVRKIGARLEDYKQSNYVALLHRAGFNAR